MLATTKKRESLYLLNNIKVLKNNQTIYFYNNQTIFFSVTTKIKQVV
jgi:hypothetical protein